MQTTNCAECEDGYTLIDSGGFNVCQGKSDTQLSHEYVCIVPVFSDMLNTLRRHVAQSNQPQSRQVGL